MSFFAKQRVKNGANTTGALLPRRSYKRVRGTSGAAGRKDSGALALAMAKRALQATRKLESSVELKFSENNFTNYYTGTDCTGQWPGSTGAVVGNGGAVCPLTYIGQGSTDLTRVGEQIVAREIEIRGHIAKGEDTLPAGAMRMIVFRDKQTTPFSGQPLPANVLQLLRTHSLLLWDNIDRYEIYTDQLISWDGALSGNTANPSGTLRVPFHYKKKINVPVHFNAGTANSVEKNGIYVLFLIDVYSKSAVGDTTWTVAPGEYILMDCAARLKFTDS